MRTRITIAIVVTMLSSVVLIFWNNGVASAANPAPKPEYVLSSHDYLPIQDLEPVW